MDISVIVPLFNEAESLPELYAWIQRVMNENKFTYEVIFVNDGSTDKSGDIDFFGINYYSPEFVEEMISGTNSSRDPSQYPFAYSAKPASDDI